MGRWRILSLPDIEAIAENGGYTGIAALSNVSAVLLLSLCKVARQPSRWKGAGDALTVGEYDTIDEYVSQAEKELMLSTIGLIMPYAGAIIPGYTLLCDGTQYQRVDYPDLYSVLDSAFIVDADNFIVPDLSDRFIFGVGVDDVGDSGGAETHNLDVGQLATHTHTNTPHNHTYSSPIPGVTLVGAGAPLPHVASVLPSVVGASGITIDTTGNGDDINHMPPYLTLSYVIVAGN